ncbi:MAG: gliding motility-associated C-terminal domain-containing protein [Cytophagaceae bacterium]|nr:gliding motility-associated C-terminal domain-containing protein [Cytophagaceae bacterium]
MKRNSLHIVLIVLLLLLQGRLCIAATGYVFPDANFKAYLLANRPSVIYPDGSLNITAANAATGPFKCYNQNISNLDGIQYFTNISTLEVKYNPNLHSLPNIDGLTSITTLGLDSNDLTSLPNLSTLVNLQVLSFHHNRVVVLPSISNLSQLKVLFAQSNQLTALPSLSAQVNLDKLFISDNPLTAIPSMSSLVKLTYFSAHRLPLTSLPSLTNCVLLEYLVCSENQMIAVPNITNCAQLKELWMPECKLNTLPDLSSYTQLHTVNVSISELSFEDLLPSTLNPGFNLIDFNFTGQQPGTAGSINVLTTNAVVIDLGFDNALPNNIYTWYKDGVFFTTTTINKLNFASVSLNDGGIYTCNVTNTTPSVAGITLTARPITLRVSPCIASNNLYYSIENTACTYPIVVALDESSFNAGTGPFTYKIATKKDTLAFNTPTFSLSKEGVFDILVKDATGCEVTFESKLKIERNSECDPVFYPNGDGVADSYYIESTGTAQIYNRMGELVKELTVPAYWDGSTKKGQDAPSGLYVIVVNKDLTIRVTLLR